jgi:site-specific DNA-methyltransferase (adenine-specific)
MGVTFKDYIDSPEVRAAFLKQFSGKRVGNWQDVATPTVVVKGMLDLIKDTPDLLYCVLFNLEFLEELVYVRGGIERDRIMFMADCAEEASLAMGMYGVKTFELPSVVRDPKKVIESVGGKLCKAFYEGGDMPKTNKIVVVGNPPYNSGSNGKDSKPIYNLFVEAILDNVHPRFFSFIIPSKWMVGGKIPDAYRKRMMSDKHHKVIRHFTGDDSVFGKSALIKGGVNYFLWDREYNGKCLFYNGADDKNGMLRHLDDYEIIVQDNKALPIVDRVLSMHKGAYLKDAVLSRKPFGLRSDFDGFLASGTPCYCMRKTVNFVSPTAFTDRAGALGKWKVCTSKGINPNKHGNFDVYNSLFIAEPGSVCTETYLVVHCFDSLNEAQSFLAYMNTKVFRFLLGENLAGNQNLSKENFAWVPDLASYQSAPDDKGLCDLFGITEDEWKYIDKKIS